MINPKTFRKDVLSMTQGQLASALNRSQPTVCEWEARGAFPTGVLGEVRDLGRKMFKADWRDSWLFENAPSNPLPQPHRGGD